MAPLRSFENSRRIAVSIDLDRTAARAWTKSLAPYFGVVAAVAPSLCLCLKGYCSPLTPLVELLNSLFGALRAFRSPIPLNVPGPLPSRRTAGERSFPSIPSFPWSAEDKLIPVVLERCYVPFTSAKVAFCFLASFLLFTSIDFWISLGCVSFTFVLSLWLETMGEKFFSWEFRAHSDSKYSALDPAARPIDCTVNSYEN